MPFSIVYSIYIYYHHNQGGCYNHHYSNNIFIYFLFKWQMLFGCYYRQRLKERRELEEKEQNGMRSNNVKSYIMFLILSPKLAISPISQKDNGN